MLSWKLPSSSWVEALAVLGQELGFHYQGTVVLCLVTQLGPTFSTLDCSQQGYSVPWDFSDNSSEYWSGCHSPPVGSS